MIRHVRCGVPRKRALSLAVSRHGKIIKLLSVKEFFMPSKLMWERSRVAGAGAARHRLARPAQPVGR